VNSERYIGLDVHQATISVAVLAIAPRTSLRAQLVQWGFCYSNPFECDNSPAFIDLPAFPP
jgi:hypothetical protein